MSQKKRVIAAMSGGVDSSVAAALFVEKGYEVIGVTLKMKDCDNNREKVKSCCGLDDNIQARMVAEKLGIKHYFLDVREDFEKRVLRYAWDEYSRGNTPNPCAMCNYYLKFGALIEYADKLGCEGVVSGHYAIIKEDELGEPTLHSGIDDKKDQVYFLSTLSKDQLKKSFMPLGSYTKEAVREIANNRGFSNANKSESQDACFGYRGETFAQTLKRYFKEDSVKGRIIGEDGTFFKEHEGIQNFTIGQRKGTGVALGVPAYISKIDAETGDVTLSRDTSVLLGKKFIAHKMNWLIEPEDSFDCSVQIRYNQTAVKAAVTKIDKGSYLVTFKEYVRAITSGQIVAFYEGSRLLGGGWIKEKVKE